MSNINRWENAEPGVMRRIFPPGQTLMMMEVRFEAGAEGYLHSHEHEQLSYLAQGRLAFTINGETTVLAAGESIAIPSNALHGVKALAPSVLIDAFTPVREDLVKR
ncbi:cupin domain-containing protein [Paenibacillus methanolicus]|uniref:Cupin domain-containing protein n=1 Tax=Paenibacillus methanolicus TaxID=582686 RepID=A0A5S5C667_9BACL|nr:cupin domain-containing protein [Paenibacillus methanolicus]TYP74834.1 Cupin domain-containing protein [Paenibacillus methanolicus]